MENNQCCGGSHPFPNDSNGSLLKYVGCTINIKYYECRACGGILQFTYNSGTGTYTKILPAEKFESCPTSPTHN